MSKTIHFLKDVLKEERQDYILERLRINRRVLTSELSLFLAVSEDTIRRDLKELSDSGKIKKVHGGAVSQGGHPYSFREREVFALERKICLAEKALSIFEDGQIVVMDGGTTNLELVKRIPKSLTLTIFTNSLPVAVYLTNHPKVEVIFLGGRLLKNEKVTSGIEGLQTLQNLHADICILGTRSIDAEFGVSENNWEETNVKRAMVAEAKRVVTLVISEKLDSKNPYRVAPIERIQTMVVDLDQDDPALDKYKHKGIQII